MRLFRFILLFALLIFLAVPAVLAFLVLEKTPTVQEAKTINPEQAVHARDLLNLSLKKLIIYGYSASIYISASEEELNSLMTLMERGMPRLRGHINITPQRLYAVLTYRLPHNPIGDFLNIHFGIIPSESGIYLSQVSLGGVKMPGKIALTIIRLVLDMFLGNQNGRVFLNSVQSVVIKQNNVTFNLRRIPDIMERKEKLLQRSKVFLDSVPLLSNSKTVRVYYTMLLHLGSRIQMRQPVSLSYFIGPVFRLAQQRSSDTGNPVEENRAALLALLMYAGDIRFEKLIGSVQTEEMKLHQIRNPNILLAGREDLRRHFVISAGLKIISDSGITFAIGEFKELLDSGRGGSGFSFADLAADISGARLAEAATDRFHASKIQSVLAGEAREYMFFPVVYDLPEYLSQADFESRYGNVENTKYVHLVTAIKERISQLPAYSAMRLKE